MAAAAGADAHNACPACGSQRLVAGRILAFGAHTGNASRFFPDGLKLMTLRRGLLLERRPVFDACTDCGQVWSRVDARALRELVDRHGRESARAVLSQPGPTPKRS